MIVLPGPVSAGSLEAGSLEVAVLLVSKAGKEQGGSYQPLSSAPFDLLMTFAIGCTQPEVMRNARLDEAQAGIKIARSNINNLRYADDITLMAESEEELKSLLMKVKEESEKNWLKTQHSENEDHGIWSHHFMANRWGNSGNSVRLYFEGAPKSLQIVIAARKLSDACSLGEKL